MTAEGSFIFGEYQMLAESGLFDAEYYLESNPDIAGLNIDPLTHYVERGGRERRDPSADFDTSYYLKRCHALGESPINPLVHYLTVGRSLGLTSKRTSKRRILRKESFGSNDSVVIAQGQPAAIAPAAVLSIDIPKIVDGKASLTVHSGLSIVGWGLGGVGTGSVTRVEIALDGHVVTNARYGLRRSDVATAHPQWKDALLSGYAAHLPPKALADGYHSVTVSMHDANRELARIDFSIEVSGISDENGPWALCRKSTLAEVEAKHRTLATLNWRPRFHVYLVLIPTDEGIKAAFRTIDSLARQTYSNWLLSVVPPRESTHSYRSWRAIAQKILTTFGDVSSQMAIADSEYRSQCTKLGSAKLTSCKFVSRMVSGDEYGCDALLEFAVATAAEQPAELFYSDERRRDPVGGKIEAFFKPGWSPDLALSMNYIGRAWFAHHGLLESARISAADIGVLGDFEINMRLAEAAAHIEHIPKVLCQRGRLGNESSSQERLALKAALARRGIAAEVGAPNSFGSYRVKRRLLSPDKVSIVIPTRAANGHIKSCIETLQAITRYQNYELICIENIPRHQWEWKEWVRQRADFVIETKKQFNWSQYNNQAVKHAQGEYLLFLNDDTEIIDPDWLDALLEQVQRKEVGVVGPLLLYPDHSIQEAGVMLDAAGRGRHAFRHLPEHDPGYFGLALTQRNVVSVTGACLITRRQTFDTLRGFDEANAIINNDLDYCLRAREIGLVNVYTPYSRLIHHELASRSQLSEQYDVKKFTRRWRNLIAKGDPYFNPHLSRDHEAFTIEREPVELVRAGRPLFAHSMVRRILAVKLDHIGDCVTALPAVRRLKRHFPNSMITILSAGASLEIWKAEPSVDQVMEFNFFHARSAAGKLEVDERALRSLGALLRGKRFDLALDLRKQPDTRHLLQLCGASILAGFDSQGRFPWLDVALEWDEDVPLRKKHGHITDDLIALVDTIAARGEVETHTGLKLPKHHLPLSALVKRHLDSKPLICVHPAAGSPMRQWPPNRFSELIELLMENQHYNIALIGGADERCLATQVLTLVGDSRRVINLVGRLSLLETCLVIAKSLLFVGNNSGPHHLAASLGVPTVGIHSGVVDVREWAPQGELAVAIRRNMSCSPCYLERPEDCHRKLECLTGLPVADVYRICRQLLAESDGILKSRKAPQLIGSRKERSQRDRQL